MMKDETDGSAAAHRALSDSSFILPPSSFSSAHLRHVAVRARDHVDADDLADASGEDVEEEIAARAGRSERLAIRTLSEVLLELGPDDVHVRGVLGADRDVGVLGRVGGQVAQLVQHEHRAGVGAEELDAFGGQAGAMFTSFCGRQA